MSMPLTSRFAAAGLACALMAGCAAPSHPDSRDPWEGFNRGVYNFNDTVDHLMIRPVATLYSTVVPDPVQSCVHNIFSNLGDVWGGINLMLQERGLDAFNMWGRFMLNTTMGLGGCLDIASRTGDPKIPSDFGTTLGVWGLHQGPYLVLPLLGPSSVRDGVGITADWFGNPLALNNIHNVGLRNSLYGLTFVDKRASLLGATNTIDQTALDPYSFVRDAYLQRRAAMVRGNKPNTDALPNYNDEDETAPPAAPSPSAAPAAPAK
ncbi:MAG TPA: VacJ family lipoprotein [Bordetella sp.]|uniref:MlaA family lipoprotein n=1 Tax=Bordetella sp. TaxID=28081 RepID=UPI002ED09F2B